jgi:hypothetical protein
LKPHLDNFDQEKMYPVMSVVLKYVTYPCYLRGSL